MASVGCLLAVSVIAGWSIRPWLIAEWAGAVFDGLGLVSSDVVSGFSEAEAGVRAAHASRQHRTSCGLRPGPREAADSPGSLRDAAEQLLEAHRSPAGRDTPAVAEDQPVAAQFAYGALYGVLFAVP